jgi:aspartyl-tRNA(Asn)/glutamyl-tRNA(Gln) amidotransferase subunit A
MPLTQQTAAEHLNNLKTGDITSVELTQAYLDRIAALDKSVGAFLRVDADGALSQAASIDARRKKGETLGPLAGLPVAVKDNLCQRGGLTTCASRILETFRPPYDATVIAKLRAADAVLIGRTNLDEFAMGGSTENSAFQPTRNPWDLERTPGGSSGGSAASVAARMSPLAIGSDTGGSIRQPAGLCGVVGMKPTYGRVSRYGLVAFASSLDQIGPFGLSVEDAALLLESIAGHDPRDSTCVDTPVPDYAAALSGEVRGLRLGVPREFFVPGMEPGVEAAVRAAMDVLRDLGAEIVDVSLPSTDKGLATYYIIAPAEASANLARYDGVKYGSSAGADELWDNYERTRGSGFGAEVKRRIMLGTYALSAGYYDAYYVKAQQVRTLIKDEFDSVLADVDAILAPTSPNVAFKLGAKLDDPMAMYLNDACTLPVNIAGLPGISVPCGLADGLPVGLQVVGRAFDEATILRVADAYERAAGFADLRPPTSRPG